MGTEWCAAGTSVDRMSAAVNNLNDLSEFREAYSSLLRHYGLQGRKIQAGRANENGLLDNVTIA
jgi:hypothetical protein